MLQVRVRFPDIGQLSSGYSQMSQVQTVETLQEWRETKKQCAGVLSEQPNELSRTDDYSKRKETGGGNCGCLF